MNHIYGNGETDMDYCPECGNLKNLCGTCDLCEEEKRQDEEADDRYDVERLKEIEQKQGILKLPEYNEILYHAGALTSEQFREYWNDVQNSI